MYYLVRSAMLRKTSVSGYFGGTNNDTVDSVAGRDLNITNFGATASNDLPTTPNALDADYNGGNHDAFLAMIKLGNRPDIALTKTAKKERKGRKRFIIYEITVRNTQSTEALNVQLLDLLPAGVSFRSIDAGGGTVTRNGNQVTVNWAAIPGGQSRVVRIRTRRVGRSVANTAFASPWARDATPANNKDSATVR
jgi:uncharacterized repeat protein (TIGR01451 family)